jgi:hypothetical protein
MCLSHTCPLWPLSHVLHALLHNDSPAGALSQAGSCLHDAAAVLSGPEGVAANSCASIMFAGALSQAGSRLHDAAAVLSGPQGMGRWRLLHAQLVARRNRLVSQLADAYQVSCRTWC